MKINSIMDLYNYLNNLNYNCICFDILENIIVIENVTNEVLIKLLTELKKLNITYNQLHFSKNAIAIAINEIY